MGESNFLVSPQVAKMNAMAAKLRAEAAELEAEQQKWLVENLTQLFNSFDTNKDGKISVIELKEGLSKALKESISEEQASKILQLFDTSGDGALQRVRSSSSVRSPSPQS